MLVPGLAQPTGNILRTKTRPGAVNYAVSRTASQPAVVPRRILTTTGWRHKGRCASGRHEVPVEEKLHITIPPWVDGSKVHIRLDAGADIRTVPDEVRRAAAEKHLATLPEDAVWIWSDGSAEGGTTAGGGGALITLPSGEHHQIREPAGAVCSSTRAELVALRAALEAVQRMGANLGERPLVICTDSQAALATLASGAGAKSTVLEQKYGACSWQPKRRADGCSCNECPPTVDCPETRRRTSWPRRPPAFRRKTFLWTSAAAPKQHLKRERTPSMCTS